MSYAIGYTALFIILNLVGEHDRQPENLELIGVKVHNSDVYKYDKWGNFTPETKKILGVK